MNTFELIITDYSEFKTLFRWSGYIYYGTVLIDGRYYMFWNRSEIVDEAEPWTVYFWNGIKTAERDVSGRTFYAVYPINDVLNEKAKRGNFPSINHDDFPIVWKDGITKPIGYIIGKYSDTEYHDETKRWQNWDKVEDRDIPPELQELFDNLTEDDE